MADKERDLALENKETQFKTIVLQGLERLEEENKKDNLEEETKSLTQETNIKDFVITISKDDNKTSISFLGVEIGNIKNEQEIEYNKENIKKLLLALELSDKRPPVSQETMEFLEYISREREQDKDNSKKKQEINERKEEEEETGDQEKDDEEKPEIEEDKEDIDEMKEEIAKEHNLNVNQIIHISKTEKITKDQKFGEIANFAKGYDDIFMLQGDDPYTWKTIGIKDGKQQEIENEQFRQMGGKSPDVTIKKLENGKVTEVNALAMYKIDETTAVAIVMGKQGKKEALYCRQEAGDKKAFFGSLIPEASGRNVKQKDANTREFMSYKNTSARDLREAADNYEKASDLNKRGEPSGTKEGEVLREQIEGNADKIREERKQKIKDDLYKRLGIDEKLKGAMPGYLDYMDKKIGEEADRVMELMDNDEKIDYESAIKQAEAEADQREEGGRTPGEPARDPRRG